MNSSTQEMSQMYNALNTEQLFQEIHYRQQQLNRSRMPRRRTGEPKVRKTARPA